MRGAAARVKRSAVALCVTALASAFFLAPRAASAEPSALDRARAAIARGDFSLAESELVAAATGSTKAEALLEQARLRLATGRYAEAVTIAHAAWGSNAALRRDAAPVEAEALARQGKVDEAIDALRPVVQDTGAYRANVMMGELLLLRGKTAEARAALRTVIRAYNDDKIVDTDPVGLTFVGRAEHLLRNAKQANHAYNLAEQAGGRKLTETLLARADLFLERYQPGQAAEVIREALKLAPRSPEAHVAMARAKLENAMDFAGAEHEIALALEVNPHLASAYAVRAGLALRTMDIVAADAATDDGLRTNADDLELLAMKAAARFLADDTPAFESLKRRVLTLNPKNSRFFSIVGEFAEWEHRYNDIVAMMREATSVDPDDGKAYATLGLNLIRAGDDAGGIAALRASWDRDKFNVRVLNTLNLYEKTIPVDYETVEGATFRIRYAKDEKAILERYAPRMLDEAWASMVQRYGFTPKTPVAVELYATSETFAVRTSGLPNVGIQGVCFGQTLAALSPQALAHNWGQVLWHELAHVFAIQLSKNHVPRWFTEGLSEYETIIRRSEWQREEDVALYQALVDGRIPPIDGMNRAFTHVDSVEDVTMAYYAASQVVLFVAQEFGFPKIVSMLEAWGRGLRTPEVVRSSLGIESSELDRLFRAWVGEKLARYAHHFVPDVRVVPESEAESAATAHPADPIAKIKLARVRLAAGRESEALALLAEAEQLDPKNPDAAYMRLQLAMRDKKSDLAERIAAGLITSGHDGYAVRMKAADIAEAKGDVPRMKEHLERAAELDPSEAEPLQALADLAHKAKSAKGELDVLRRLAGLDQHDRRVWNRLLGGLVAIGAWDEAERAGQSAMFIDVENASTHRAYAQALARKGRFISAIEELNSAILCKPDARSLGEIYGDLAQAYGKLGLREYEKKSKEYRDSVAHSPAATTPPSRPSQGAGDADDD